jgi:serine O-acetyltransferase
LDKAPGHSPARASLRALIAADIHAQIDQAAAFAGRRFGMLRRISVLLTPPLLCVLIHRLAHACWQRRHLRLAAALFRLNYRMHKAWIPPDTSAGPGLYIPHPAGVVLEADAGDHVKVFANAVVTSDRDDHGRRVRPTLGSHVTLGAFVVIRGRIRIEDHASVGPSCVVHADVPAHAMMICAADRP